MARRKTQPALDVPATREEAGRLLEQYVGVERAALKIRIDYEIRIDELKAERDRALTAIAEVQTSRFASLKAWWEAGGKDLAGKARSAQIGAAKLGIRLTPPAVKFARGIKAEAIVEWLGSTSWGEASRFLRTGKITLDKDAIIKGARADDHVAAIFEGKGATVIQVDEFFIDTGLDEEAIRAEISVA